ncbi:MAG: right-handed parallel beta-helix repeat-containing protein [Candidatus Woesearchaeota archaeon]
MFKYFGKYKLKSLSFFVLYYILSIFSLQVQATNYYIDAINGNDLNNGISPTAPWKSVSKVNSSIFSPGDNIYFKRDNFWREQLIIPSSGTKENPITFSAYGVGNNPTITSSIDITGKYEDWKEIDSNIWTRPLVKETKLVIFNYNQLGILTDKLDAPFKFNWIKNNIYIFSEQNPTYFYKKIEAIQSGSVISINNQKFITLDSLNIYGGQLEGDHTGPGGCIYIPAQSDNIIIKKFSISKCHGGGLRIIGATNITIDENIISDIDSYRSTLSGDGITVSWEFKTEKKPKNISITKNTINGFIDRMGIAVLDCNGLSISNNLITAGVTGIDIEPNENTNQGVINAIISSNIINKNIYERLPVNNGISVSGANSYNIKIENNIIDNNNSNPGIGIIVFGKIKNVNIISNTIRNSRIGIQIGSGANNIVLENNYISAGYTNHLYGCYLKGNSTSILTQNTIDGQYDNSIFVDEPGTTVDAYYNIFKDYGKYGLQVMDTPSKIFFKKNTFKSPNVIFHFIIPSNVIATLDENLYYPPGNFYRWHSKTYNFEGYKSISGQDFKGMELEVIKPLPPTLLK